MTVRWRACASVVTVLVVLSVASAMGQQAQIMPILDHIHLNVPDQAKAVEWYQKNFGGETAKLKDRIDGVRYSGVWILAQRGDATPSEGHAIDHIGWRTNDLNAKTTEYKGQGVTFTTEPRPLRLASGVTVNYAYPEGPAGAKIELVQR